MLVHLWVLPPEVLEVSPQRLPVQVEAQEVAGLPANCWAVLACFKHPKVMITSRHFEAFLTFCF